VEDAVQEIFIDVWNHASRFDPSIASETTFVAMLARRTLIDRRRKRARQGETMPIPVDLAARNVEGPAERAARQDEAGRAARALGRLGDNQRKVLTLSIYHGLTYKQIAKVTGFPLGTVKTHARRGLIQLRRDLDAGSPDDQDEPLPSAPISRGGDA
jgi:RNA polymerase sigma-70 factor (ECF subfamily)